MAVLPVLLVPDELPLDDDVLLDGAWSPCGRSAGYVSSGGCGIEYVPIGVLLTALFLGRRRSQNLDARAFCARQHLQRAGSHLGKPII